MTASTTIQLGIACLFLLQTVFAAPSEIGVIPDIFELASEDCPDINEADLYHVSQLHQATCRADILRGEAFLSQELISAIKRKAGIFSARHPKKEEEESGAFVATRRLINTSPVHADHHKASGQLVGEDKKIGFVFLNSNPDAFFKYGDTEVSIVKNTFVHFKGRYPHNTVINSGEVSLLGPFEIFSAWGTSTKKFVVGQGCVGQKCNDDLYLGKNTDNNDGNNGACGDGFEEILSAAECEAALKGIEDCLLENGPIFQYTEDITFDTDDPGDPGPPGRGCVLDLLRGSLIWNSNKDATARVLSLPVCKGMPPVTTKEKKSAKKNKKTKGPKSL